VAATFPNNLIVLPSTIKMSSPVDILSNLVRFESESLDPQTVIGLLIKNVFQFILQVVVYIWKNCALEELYF